MLHIIGNNKFMRILNIIHAQFIGGVDQVFRDYNQVFLDHDNELAIVISDNGYDNYILPGLKKIYKLKNITPALDIIHLLSIIYSFKPDVIVCHSLRTLRWMKFLKPLISAKTVAINHGITFQKSLNCDYVFSINQTIADLVITAGKAPNCSIFIPNMIKIDQDFVIKKFHNPVVIGMFGRIEYRKGFDILIKAAAILRKDNINFKLQLVGFSVSNSSYNENSLKQLVQENNLEDIVEFVGTVKNKKQFFDSIDILCVPSREEPFGLVIIESFFYSTPVISSNSDGSKMLIKDGEDGLIFATQDCQDLAEKIKLLIKNQELALSISKAAFIKVKNQYSLGAVGDKLQLELEKIINKK